jgi:hypothetical protein
MSLLEKFIYTAIVFVAVYVLLSLAFRLFEITSDYVSHMVGGISATILGVGVFMYLLIKK